MKKALLKAVMNKKKTEKPYQTSSAIVSRWSKYVYKEMEQDTNKNS